MRSAFGHAGQKCSAASLAIVEAPLHDDPAFLRPPRRRRAHASASGRRPTWPPSWARSSRRRPGRCERALTTLDPASAGSSSPRRLDDGGRLWSPGVRIGVQPGSWFHRTECFGPVLGVIRADDLDHAVRDPERRRVRAHRRAAQPRRGRDRALAGAGRGRQRLRQPPHHGRHRAAPAVRRLEALGGRARRQDRRSGRRRPLRDVPPRPRRRTRRRATASYQRWWAERFGAAIDRSGLAAERNVLRYRPVAGVVVRVGADDARTIDVASLRAAAGRRPACRSTVADRRRRPSLGRARRRRGRARARPRPARRRRARGLPRRRRRRRPDRRHPRRARRAAVLAARAGDLVDGAPSWPRRRPAWSRMAHRDPDDRAAGSRPGPRSSRPRPQVFAEKQFLATNVADIATRAGTAHGTFYRYFDSKEDDLPRGRPRPAAQDARAR